MSGTTGSPTPSVKLFFFGPRSSQIFGAYHPPHSGSGPVHGVILCYPMGQEAIWSHRAFRLLSERFARAGLHALRFDYFGSGDSAGTSEEGDARRWMDDIGFAIEEMRASQPVAGVSLVGLRLGATMAALVGAQCGDIENLVLWEPVLDGKEYVEEELAGHQAWTQHLPKQSEPYSGSNDDSEIRGFPLTNAMRKSVAELDLLGLRKTPARRVLTIEREPTLSAKLLQRQLSQLNADLHYMQVPGREIWRWLPDQAVVPRQTLECITEWLVGASR